MPTAVPQLGDIGLTPSRGFVAWGIRTVTHGPYAHAFLYAGPDAQGRDILEADPHGARRWWSSKYPDVVWLTGLSAHLTDVQRHQIVIWATAHLGTPYSWLDDLAIGLVDVFGWAPKTLRNRMWSDSTLMCSQYDVEAYRAAGRNLFPATPGGAICPNDLWRAEQHARQKAAA